MPGEPYHGRERGPDMKAVANEREAIGRSNTRVIRYGSMNCVNRHRTSPPMNQKSAAELTLGGWHFARGARIDRDRRPQCPRQTLEAGFGDMMAILAI